MSEGSINRLDTKSFNDTIQAYASHIRQFESIVSGVNNTASTIIGKWKGQGSKAFEKDCLQVKQNLKDITEIMENIKESLIHARDEYISTDNELSNELEFA